MASRGYRNNNPGNIILAKRIFPGEIPSTDSRFKQFRNMEHGYEAVFLLLQVYLSKGVNTIEKIIRRYCPDETAEAYIASVTQSTGKSRYQIIDRNDWQTLKALVIAISEVENGVGASPVKVAAGMILAKAWMKRQQIIFYGSIILLVLLFLALVVVIYLNRKILLS